MAILLLHTLTFWCVFILTIKIIICECSRHSNQPKLQPKDKWFTTNTSPKHYLLSLDKALVGLSLHKTESRRIKFEDTLNFRI